MSRIIKFYSKTLWIQLQNLMDPTPKPYGSNSKTLKICPPPLIRGAAEVYLRLSYYDRSRSGQLKWDWGDHRLFSTRLWRPLQCRVSLVHARQSITVKFVYAACTRDTNQKVVFKLPEFQERLIIWFLVTDHHRPPLPMRALKKGYFNGPTSMSPS